MTAPETRSAAPAFATTRQVSKTAVAAILALLFMLACASTFVHARVWWLELARFVPYPVYLAAGALALGLSLRLGRAWRIAAVIGLALVATVVMGLAFGRGDKGSRPLRMMTYNVKAYHEAARADGFSRIAWEVIQADPDVLVLQDAGRLLADGKPMSEAVRTMLGTREVYGFGQYVVASRYPLKNCRPGEIAFRGQSHSYVRCTVQVADVAVELVTAHFLSPREGLNATRNEGDVEDWEQNFADRLAQADRLADDLAAAPRPLIVAGDLNAPEGSPVVRALFDIGLRDAFSSSTIGYGFTHGHSLRPGFSFLRIDHILVSPTLGVRDCSVGGKEGSDHRPVIADLWLARE